MHTKSIILQPKSILNDKIMNEKELRELLARMRECGIHAELCDSPVPVSSNPVKCGMPADVGDVNMDDYFLLPKSMLGLHPEVFIPVSGDSMMNAGYEEGDQLRVRLEQRAMDGDNVLVSVDREFTVKTLFHDESGQMWLVPQNELYDAMLMTEEQDVNIYGVVVGVEKRTPRSSWSLCAKKVSQTKRKMAAAQRLEDWQVDDAIRAISGKVVHARQWYAVYRAMLDCKVADDDTYVAFCDRVADLLPDHAHLPTARELQRMAVGSFSKPVVLWSEKNAPVTGIRFRDYKAIAVAMTDLLSNSPKTLQNSPKKGQNSPARA